MLSVRLCVIYLIEYEVTGLSFKKWHALLVKNKES